MKIQIKNSWTGIFNPTRLISLVSSHGSMFEVVNVLSKLEAEDLAETTEDLNFFGAEWRS